MTLSASQVSWEVAGKRVLSEISVDVVPGVVTAVLGPNGAGKSTLLRLLSGELQPAGGEVHIDGERLSELSIEEKAKRRSVMAQSGPLAFDFLVEEVLSMGWVRDKNREALIAPLHEVGEKCAVGHLIGRKFMSLSGGERQRVHFARALLQVWPEAHPPPFELRRHRYILLDEPTSGLDPAHELSILRLARSAAEAGLGILVVLHNLNLAARFADQALLLNRGETAAFGAPGSVFTDDALSNLYDTPVLVERHAQLERLVVHTR